jgi:hypothetical protein
MQLLKHNKSFERTRLIVGCFPWPPVCAAHLKRWASLRGSLCTKEVVSAETFTIVLKANSAISAIVIARAVEKLVVPLTARTPGWKDRTSPYLTHQEYCASTNPHLVNFERSVPTAVLPSTLISQRPRGLFEFASARSIRPSPSTQKLIPSSATKHLGRLFMAIFPSSTSGRHAMCSFRQDRGSRDA